MMIGVAQVIGMNPTFRSFVSSAPAPCANSSIALLRGEELRERGKRGRGADRSQECAARSISGKDGAHDRRGDGALVASRSGRDALALFRLLVLGAICMHPAGAAHIARPMIGIKLEG